MKFNKSIVKKIISITLIVFIGNQLLFAQEKDEKKDKKEKVSLRDPEDGTFDMSAYLSTATGFLPVPYIITEPALGYGGGLVITFLHPQKKI